MWNITLIFLLIVFWIVNSGIFHGFLIFCGIISVLSTFMIYRFMIKITKESFNENFDIFEKSPKFLKIVVFLFKSAYEICKSSLLFMRNILINKKVESDFVEINMKNMSDNPILMLIAHSITVTPGSISVFQKSNNEIVVHCLYQDIKDDIQKMNHFFDFVNFMKK